MQRKGSERRRWVVESPAQEYVDGCIAMLRPGVDRHMRFRQQRDARYPMPLAEMMKMEADDSRARTVGSRSQSGFDQCGIVKDWTAIKVRQQVPAVVGGRRRHSSVSNG